MEGKTNNKDMKNVVNKDKKAKTPRQRFVEAAPIRVNNVLKHIRLVKNLLNRNYSYNTDEFQQILDDISLELRYVKNKFDEERKKKEKSSKWKLSTK